MAKPPEKKRNTGREGKGGRPPRMWRATAPKPHRLGLVAVKHRQAMAERAAQTEQRGKAFTALAHVAAVAAGGMPTTGNGAPQPHRPPTVGGPNHGQRCDHCRNMFASIRAHYAGGCPAMKMG